MTVRQIAVGIAKSKARTSGSVHSVLSQMVLLVSSFIVVLVSAYATIGEPELHRDWPVYVSLVCVAWLAVYFGCSYLQFKTLYLFTSVYILALCLFHLGITIPVAIGWIDVPDWTAGDMAPWIERTGWYTALSLGCIGMGFALSMKRSNFKVEKHLTDVPVAHRNLSVAYWDGMGLLAASIVFLALAIYSVGNLLNYSRNDFFRGVGDTRGLGAFLFVFPSSVLLLAIGARKSWEKTIAVVITFFAFVGVLLSGYRTSVFFPLLVGAILWVKTGRRIPVVVAVSLMALVLLAIPVIGALRAMGPYSKIDKRDIEVSVKSASVARSFMEMGQTAAVAAHIFRLVPDTDPYRYGTTYLQEIDRSIPNISSSQNVSERIKGKQKSFLRPDVLANLPPADWLTYRIAPEKFDIGQGVGFSAIGEPYLNFGPAGIVVFFIGLGFLLGRLDSANLLNSPNLLVFAIAMVWPLMRTARDDFGNFIKPAVFMLVVLIIWRGVTWFISPGNRKGKAGGKVANQPARQEKVITALSKSESRAKSL